MLSSVKRAGTRRSPLSDAAWLLQVLGYVGPGHWLFAEVNKLWHQTYKMMAIADLPEVQIDLFEEALTFSCCPQMTLGHGSDGRTLQSCLSGRFVVPCKRTGLIIWQDCLLTRAH
jgi:hypothetical protein